MLLLYFFSSFRCCLLLLFCLSFYSISLCIRRQVRWAIKKAMDWFEWQGNVIFFLSFRIIHSRNCCELKSKWLFIMTKRMANNWVWNTKRVEYKKKSANKNKISKRHKELVKRIQHQGSVDIKELVRNIA